MSLADLIKEAVGGTAAFNDDSMPGNNVRGEVISAIVRQVNKYQPPGTIGPKIPEVWDNGDPKQQVVITLRTADRNPADPEDEGIRSVYVKWWGGQRAALLAALSAVKAEDVLPGGQFYAEFLGLGDKQPGMNAAKVYRFAYQPPSGTAGLFAASNGNTAGNGGSNGAQQSPLSLPVNPVLSGFVVPPERAPGTAFDPFTAPAKANGTGYAPGGMVGMVAPTPTAGQAGQPWLTPTAANVARPAPAVPAAEVPVAPPAGDMVALVKQIRELNGMGVPLGTIAAMTSQDAVVISAILAAPVA